MWTNLGDWSRTTDYSTAAAALAQRVGEAAALTPDDVVVDYACGFGDSLRLWITHFGVRRVVGVEADPEICATIRARVEGWGLRDRIRVIQRRAESLTPRAADAEVTAVVCVDAAYHFASRLAWWQAALADLAPGGRIACADVVLGDGRHAGPFARVCANAMRIPAANLVDARTLERELEAAGATEVSVQRIGAAVLDGFVAHAPRRDVRVRITAAAIRWLRARGTLEAILVSGRRSAD